ncbi:hypothetical protein EPN90_01680 [Patescibacteria group bacterium]|nr:MAG: hypothetical protein EPN90_01680 [Patescibacteria group bacterium]
MPSALQLFVKEALEKKIPKPQIAEALKKAGWQEDEVNSALGAFADVDFPLAVPRRKPYLSAREAFLYLLMFLTLYISAYYFGSLLFTFINRALPDPLIPIYDFKYAVRLPTASLIVAFPLFLWLSTYLRRTIRRDSEKKASKIRKWLTYITLFIAAGVIIGDLITLIFNLLGGELTLRFELKVLTVFAIAGAIFGYYLWDLRAEEKEA